MWLFKEKVIESIEEMPQDTYGFIYLVTHLPSNRKYIGKKVLYFERNVKIGKKELQSLKEKRKAKGISGGPPSKKKVVKNRTGRPTTDLKQRLKS